jgi:hypothetical protein
VEIQVVARSEHLIYSFGLGGYCCALKPARPAPERRCWRSSRIVRPPP